MKEKNEIICLYSFCVTWRAMHSSNHSIKKLRFNCENEEIALWTGVKGNGSVNSRDDTKGMGSTMGTGLTVGMGSTMGMGSTVGIGSTIGMGSTVGMGSTMSMGSTVGMESTIANGAHHGRVWSHGKRVHRGYWVCCD